MAENDVLEAIEARLKDELSVEFVILPDPIATALARLAAAENTAVSPSASGSRSRLELAATLPL